MYSLEKTDTKIPSYCASQLSLIMASNIGFYGQYWPPGYPSYGMFPTDNLYGRYDGGFQAFESALDVIQSSFAPDVPASSSHVPSMQRNPNIIVYQLQKLDVIIGIKFKKKSANSLFINHVRRSVNGNLRCHHEKREEFARVVQEWRLTGGDFLIPAKDIKGKSCYVLATNEEAADYARNHFNDARQNAAKREREKLMLNRLLRCLFMKPFLHFIPISFLEKSSMERVPQKRKSSRVKWSSLSEK